MKHRLTVFAALALAGFVNLASAVPPPRPAPEIPVKPCSIERPHKPHDWQGPGGKTFHCPGVPGKK
jgi:hypothetical protein